MEIEKEVAAAVAMECTEDTIQAVKKVRADLNKKFTVIENRRKEIKKAVMAPYDDLEREYKTLITDKFTSADTALRVKISDIEDALKAAKHSEVLAYFNEYAESLGITDVKFESAKINVTLTASAKSMKDQAKAFLDGVKKDTDAIMQMDHAAEIMAEYRKHYQFGAAVATVFDRHKAAEKEKERIAELQRKVAHDLEAIKRVEAVFEKAAQPVSEPNLDEILTMPFTATSTRAKLRALKEYMTKEGIKYE